MKILFVGDVMGRSGRSVIKSCLNEIKKEYSIDFTIVNAENASGYAGLVKSSYDELISAGADFITTGNHIWAKKEIFDFIENHDNLLRPANYPPPCPGKGYAVVRTNKIRLGIVNLSGTVFMDSLDNPFLSFDKIYEIIKPACDIIFVDFHAEATSEKIAFSYYAAGRADVVVGTHTHVQTADERIIEPHTAAITDVGMTGPCEGVIGIDKDIIIKSFKTKRPVKFELAEGKRQFCAVCVTFDENNVCVKIERIFRIFD